MAANTATTDKDAVVPSVLATLRALAPNRTLQFGEALRIAELQANHLLELSGVTEVPVPIDVVTALPRILISYDLDLPVSGTSHWDTHRRSWVITLCAMEPDTRQRFTLLHEYKHIVDYGGSGLIAPRSGKAFGLTPTEFVADYFAGCVLMPKRWVKAAWGGGVQRTSALAELFDVSARAIDVRTRQLGLAEPQSRCLPTTSQAYRGLVPARHGSYHRRLAANEANAAGSAGGLT